jgi:uncharacterized protein YxeA
MEECRDAKTRTSFIVIMGLVIIALIIPCWLAASAYDYGRHLGYIEGLNDYKMINETMCEYQMQEQLQNYKEDMAVMRAKCGG